MDYLTKDTTEALKQNSECDVIQLLGDAQLCLVGGGCGEVVFG